MTTAERQIAPSPKPKGRYVRRVTNDERRRKLDQLEADHERNKKSNPQVDFPGLVIVDGDFGQGKTSIMARMCAIAYANGIEVYRNPGEPGITTPLYFGKPWDLAKLRRGDYYNCIISIDELRRLMATERAMSGTQVDFVDTLIAMRRHNVQVIATDQDPTNEINRRMMSRVRMNISCQALDKDALTIRATITYHRYRRPPKVERKRFTNMRQIWPYFNSFYKTRSNEYRKSKQEERAEQEQAQFNSVFQVLAVMVANGQNPVSSIRVAEECRARFNVNITSKAAAQIIQAHDFAYDKSTGNVRWWAPDGFLDGIVWEDPNEQDGEDSAA